MLRNDKHGFGIMAILFHWIIALLMLGQIALGFSMTRVASMARQFELIQWHKSVGFVVLALALLRLAWSATNSRPQSIATLSPPERAASHAVQNVLLAATIAVPLAGWALASTSTLDIPSFWFNLIIIPDLPLARTDPAEAFWGAAHAYLAYATGILALGHAGAALSHHFLHKDRVLLRMITPRDRGPEGGEARLTSGELKDLRP